MLLTEGVSRGWTTWRVAARRLLVHPAATQRHDREENVMKARLVTVYTLVITAVAVLAPLAEAGRNWP